eukprot:g3128.t1
MMEIAEADGAGDSRNSRSSSKSSPHVESVPSLVPVAHSDADDHQHHVRLHAPSKATTEAEEATKRSEVAVESQATAIGDAASKISTDAADVPASRHAVQERNDVRPAVIVAPTMMEIAEADSAGDSTKSRSSSKSSPHVESVPSLVPVAHSDADDHQHHVRLHAPSKATTEAEEATKRSEVAVESQATAIGDAASKISTDTAGVPVSLDSVHLNPPRSNLALEAVPDLTVVDSAPPHAVMSPPKPHLLMGIPLIPMALAGAHEHHDHRLCLHSPSKTAVRTPRSRRTTPAAATFATATSSKYNEEKNEAVDNTTENSPVRLDDDDVSMGDATHHPDVLTPSVPGVELSDEEHYMDDDETHDSILHFPTHDEEEEDEKEEGSDSNDGSLR